MRDRNISKNNRRTMSRREIVSYDQQISSYPTITSYRTQPKPLPSLSHPRPLTYSETLKGSSYRRNTKKELLRQDISRKSSIKSTRERFKDDNVVVVRDNALESDLVNADNASPDNLNPFHHDFNKVIENPFMKSQEVSMTTESTDDNESIISSPVVWARPSRPKETVNRAIVDIYDSDEGCDPFLKMRVSLIVSKDLQSKTKICRVSISGQNDNISPAYVSCVYAVWQSW